MLRRRGYWKYSLIVLALSLSLTASAWASTTATITVGGTEQQIGGAWDQGTITVAFNDFSETIAYGEFSSSASVASALAGMFSRDYVAQGLSAKVSCPPNITVITLTLQGTATFGPLNISGSLPSFQLSSSGFSSDATQATPVLTWPLPAAITYGTALSSTQLNATANVPGTFSYDPPAGTVLPPGSQVLGVMFTPADTTNYSVVTEAVPLTVNGSLSGGGQTVYSYGLSYEPNGNVDGYNDSVMGAWAFNYDSLNRLAGAQGSQPGNSMTNYCWSYDAFGNRWQQMGSDETISGGGGSLCEQQSGANVSYAWANYSGNNRMTSTSQNVNQASGYDAAGEVTNDGKNQYLYNADGQICAVEWTYNSMVVMTGYIYDAEGNRVTKGSITSMSCDPSVNGFTTQADYVRDQAGHQLSEFAPGQNGTMAWQHTNVYANGELIATEDNTETHFYLNDWLGTRRVQTNYMGVPEQTCSSLPYGDSETCAPTPAENLFTGKERDSESGNDYFGARYYASSMGRFMSPDPENFGANIMNPQSWNMYSYAGSNPLINIDPDGRECVWDDGSYDSADDPDSGSADKCSGLGGTWISDDIFENSIYYRGDWSGDANDTLSGLVGDIQSCSAAVGGGQAASLIVADAFASGFSNDQTAYALATASYESGPGGMGSHMTEMGSPSYFSQYDGKMGNTSPGDGYTYRGRGYVQLTGKWSYNYWTNQIGQNLVQHPSLAATPDTAAEIMVEGFDRGSFRSGNSIQDYVNSSGSNFVGARAVVNGGGDQAQTIANAATGFSNSMSGCR